MLVCRLLLVTSLALGGAHAQQEAPQEYPEGYYAFQEAPGKVPPKVRKPPYVQSRIPCLGALESPEEAELSLNNLCGDLNDGHLPLNPMGQSVMGHSYPFEQFRIIRRPIRSVGGDARMEEAELDAQGIDSVKEELLQDVRASRDTRSDNARREEEEDEEDVPAEGRAFGASNARAFCDDNWGLFCLLYNTMSGKSGASSSGIGAGAQDRHDGSGADLDSALNALGTGANGAQPLTPCPSAVEYVTPVYARNHRGMWRYVVQIPYEGYFTQTVEVTRCLASRCHYVAGGACLATPRWVSLLVAEVYYPDAHLAPSGHRSQPDLSRAAVVAPGNPPIPDPFPYDLQKRQGGTGPTSNAGSKEPPTTSEHCDGHDEVGCFQVRLYYDWFLVPGSCKCWKQDYFAQFAYRRK
ncbi:uncharacterized protein spz6 isoform X1 [Macrobrachium rosenbergii]|uniref:uncharacterized protein spz6 isoform X1 n=1 Tax=Macrobrachium rosenbergii TaxID=79674 RepID=UPI0034D45705